MKFSYIHILVFSLNLFAGESISSIVKDSIKNARKLSEMVVNPSEAIEITPKMVGNPIEEVRKPILYTNSWYPELFQVILSGHGDRDPRFGKELEIYRRYINNRKSKNSENDVLEHLGWEGNSPKKVFPFLQKTVTQFDSLAKIKPCEYPWTLPKGVQHYILWLVIPHISPEAFALNVEKGETGPLPAGYENPERVKALVEYLNWHDMWGYYGISDVVQTELLDKLPWGENIHPNNLLWNSKETKEQVTASEGKAAMKWAGRHTSQALQDFFPPKNYEVLWNRSPFHKKSVRFPEHVHVFVMPKTDPNSFEKSWKKLIEEREELF